MKKILLATIAAFTLFQQTKAQVDNYALSLSTGNSVTCGSFEELNDLKSYSLQFFLCPTSLTEGVIVLQRGDDLKATLGASGTISFTVGESTISASGISTGTWQQITLVVNEGNAKILIDGTQKATGTLEAIAQSTNPLVIGGSYDGRIDEVRIWKAALSSDFNYFINNTLNKWNPQWADLVAYYKMDQVLCPNLVDYRHIDTQTAHHGTMTVGAQRTLVSDNTKLPYLVTAAYTYNNRFFDRSVSKEQYLLSNEIIILGANSSSDGHVTPMTPNNHGTLTGGASYLEEYNGRSGVLSLDGTGSLTATTECLVPVVNSSGVTSQGYTFETWFYIDEWVKDAYLFRKENAAATKGFSIRLGEEGQIIARCNGNDYVNAGNVKTGEWMHVGITTTAATSLNQTYLFVINGKGGRTSYTSTTLSSQTIDYTPTGMDDIVAVIGENFKGKLDETMVWNQSFAVAYIKEHMNKVPMPGFNVSLDAQTMLNVSACYLYDDEDNVGFSSYSQDGWLRIMKTAYDGYQGAHFFLSVNKHDNWTSTISNATKRATFAKDLAELSEPYDGVELDLEWAYSTTEYNNYGLLAKAIKEALPEGKLFRISCHAVTYSFPKDKMQYVDGFTFQQYGPQKTYHALSNFKSSAESFASYGYANEKTFLSWSTTTSAPYKNGSANGSAVKGIKDLDSTKIDMTNSESQCQTYSDGYNYWFESPLQVYNRAAYAVSHNVKGLFYWDMGNDYPTDSYYNCAKWASYGLNSNVDPVVTNVNTPTSISLPSIDNSTNQTETPTYNILGEKVNDQYKGIVIKNGKKLISK